MRWFAAFTQIAIVGFEPTLLIVSHVSERCYQLHYTANLSLRDQKDERVATLFILTHVIGNRTPQYK